MILSNRYDPLVPDGANQLGRDCAPRALMFSSDQRRATVLNKGSSTTPCRCWLTASGRW
jgi:hypothetical protein